MNFKSQQMDSIAGLPSKPDELLKLEDSISTLVSLPPYENDVTFRCGLTFIQSKRPWEAIEALDYVYQREADHVIGQSAFAEMMFVYLDPLEEHQIIETRGKDFYLLTIVDSLQDKLLMQ